MTENNDTNYIEVGELNNTVYVKVVGTGNFKNSNPFKEFIHLMIQRNVSSFIVDLGLCSSLDSTFMGVIAGLSILLKEKCEKMLTLVNINSHILNLLTTLGIDHFITIDPIKQQGPNNLQSISDKKVSKKKLAKNMIDAHTALMSISEENRIKFQNVFEFLQKEL
ncbi:STAS domain-containing protein [Chlamydiota bacterium]